MATHNWMRPEYPLADAEPETETAPAAAVGEEWRTPVEIALAAAGFGAWLWCAYEVLLVILK